MVHGEPVRLTKINKFLYTSVFTNRVLISLYLISSPFVSSNISVITDKFGRKRTGNALQTPANGDENLISSNYIYPIYTVYRGVNLIIKNFVPSEMTDIRLLLIGKQPVTDCLDIHLIYPSVIFSLAICALQIQSCKLNLTSTIKIFPNKLD